MSYIPFTEEQKRQADAVDLEDFLLRHGERLLPSGRDKRLASDHSVTIRGSQWYDHEAKTGGGPVAFLQTFRGLSYGAGVISTGSCAWGSSVEYECRKRLRECEALILEAMGVVHQ